MSKIKKGQYRSGYRKATWGIKVEVLASKRRLDVIIPLTLDAKRQRCKRSFRLK